MKKVTLSTEKVLAAYQVVSTAKYSKLDDADKIKVWKITRALKPVATKFDEESRDAADKMKPEGFDEQLSKAQKFEAMRRDKDADMTQAPMGAAEYDKFIKDFNAYNKLVADSVNDYAKKEVELEFEPITEDAFVKLMNSNNDWTMEQVTLLGDVVCE